MQSSLANHPTALGQLPSALDGQPVPFGEGLQADMASEPKPASQAIEVPLVSPDLPAGLIGGRDDDEHPDEHWPTCRRWTIEALQQLDLDVEPFLEHRARLRALIPRLIVEIEWGVDVTDVLAQARESADVLTSWAGKVDMSSSLILAYQVTDLERFATWAREGRPPEAVPTLDERMRRFHPRRMSRAERRAHEEKDRACRRERAQRRPQEEAKMLAEYPVNEPLAAIHPRYRVEAERTGRIGLCGHLLSDMGRIVEAGMVGKVSHDIAKLAEHIPPRVQCEHPLEQLARDEIGFPKCVACGVRVTCTDELEDWLDTQELAWLDAQEHDGEHRGQSALLAPRRDDTLVAP